MTDEPVVPNYDEMWTDVYGDIQRLGPVHRHMHRMVAKLLRDLDYRSVLDIGCGPGEDFELLASGRSLSHFDGIDVSPLALEEARKKIDGEFWQLDVEKEHIDRQWDLVYCGLVLEHLKDDEAALRNMRAMTGRLLLVTTMAGDYERHRSWDEKVGHVRNYRVGELEKKLDRAGFSVEKSIYWGFPFYSPVGRTIQDRSGAGTGKFGILTRLAAGLMFYLYFLNSRHKGDLLIVLARA